MCSIKLQGKSTGVLTTTTTTTIVLLSYDMQNVCHEDDTFRQGKTHIKNSSRELGCDKYAKCKQKQKCAVSNESDNRCIVNKYNQT